VYQKWDSLHISAVLLSACPTGKGSSSSLSDTGQTLPQFLCTVRHSGEGTGFARIQEIWEGSRRFRKKGIGLNSNYVKIPQNCNGRPSCSCPKWGEKTEVGETEWDSKKPFLTAGTLAERAAEKHVSASASGVSTAAFRRHLRWFPCGCVVRLTCLAQGWVPASALPALPAPAEGAIQASSGWLPSGWGSKLAGNVLWKWMTEVLVDRSPRENARSLPKMRSTGSLPTQVQIPADRACELGRQCKHWRGASEASEEHWGIALLLLRVSWSFSWLFPPPGAHSLHLFISDPCRLPWPSVWGVFSLTNLLTNQKHSTKELETEGLFSPSSTRITAHKWLAQGLCSYGAKCNLRVSLEINWRGLQLDSSVYLSISCRFSKLNHLKWLHRGKEKTTEHPANPTTANQLPQSQRQQWVSRQGSVLDCRHSLLCPWASPPFWPCPAILWALVCELAARGTLNRLRPVISFGSRKPLGVEISIRPQVPSSSQGEWKCFSLFLSSSFLPSL